MLYSFVVYDVIGFNSLHTYKFHPLFLLLEALIYCYRAIGSKFVADGIAISMIYLSILFKLSIYYDLQKLLDILWYGLNCFSNRIGS